MGGDKNRNFLMRPFDIPVDLINSRSAQNGMTSVMPGTWGGVEDETTRLRPGSIFPASVTRSSSVSYSQTWASKIGNWD